MFHPSKRPSKVVAYSKMQILSSVSKWSLSFMYIPVLPHMYHMPCSLHPLSDQLNIISRIMTLGT